MTKPEAGLTDHYMKAHRLLEELQGKPEVELLRMPGLTVGTTLDMIVYNVPKANAEDGVAEYDSTRRRFFSCTMSGRAPF